MWDCGSVEQLLGAAWDISQTHCHWATSFLVRFTLFSSCRQEICAQKVTSKSYFLQYMCLLVVFLHVPLQTESLQ